MRIVEQSFEYIDKPSYEGVLKRIEQAGRTCYKSEGYIKDGSAEKFIRKLIQSGHESVLEHEKITLKITCDRSVSHQIVRHRIASYSQESQRYCNYSQDKFDGEVTFIAPCNFKEGGSEYYLWKKGIEWTEVFYLELLSRGVSPEEARSVLPNATKTEIVVTMNIREWRHFLKARTSAAADPQIRDIANKILRSFHNEYSVLFEDIEILD